MLPLEDEGYRQTIRVRSNDVLQREIKHPLTRPVGRPSHNANVFSHRCRYRAKPWQRESRVLADVEWHACELLSRVGFIAINLTKQSKNVGSCTTVEQWIK